MSTIIVHSSELSEEQSSVLAKKLGAIPTVCENHYRAHLETSITIEILDELRTELLLDINQLPENFDGHSVQLLITDMDSTLINIECVDEIADFVGVKPQVSAITESAMRGEIDFAASLTQRVALLDGLDVSALERVYNERLQLNPGAEVLIAGLKTRSVKTALVSGGFTFFTERLKSRLNLDYTLANVLSVNNNKLEGHVKGDIVGAEAKEAYLLQLCEELNIQPQQAIAMGDGANDLQMLNLAGLGIAYHAKPAVRAKADVSIQYRGLDAVLDFLPVS
ncbi:MAG: phosphoserine phosphatase SerB [Gammaproteobacteria bacterium]|nr:phosphoserine phosphatase SerB [Gammaproteobacteria bacterium]